MYLKYWEQKKPSASVGLIKADNDASIHADSAPSFNQRKNDQFVGTPKWQRESSQFEKRWIY